MKKILALFIFVICIIFSAACEIKKIIQEIYLRELRTTQKTAIAIRTPRKSGGTDSDPVTLLGESFTFDHVSIVLPFGFAAETSAGAQIAIPSDYPNYRDTITFTKAEADNINNYTEEALRKTFEKLINGFQKITEYRKYEMNGTDVIRLVYTLTEEGTDVTETQYYIFGSDYTDIITFSNVSGDYTKYFEESEKTIKVLKEADTVSE